MSDYQLDKAPAFTMPQTDHAKLADGIYFNLPEETYHADPAIGSSGIRDLLQSPLTYWINSPFNPDREDEEGTDATDLGDYVHDLLLHNEKRFAIKPEGMSFATKEGKAWRDSQPAGTTIIPFKQDHAAQMILKALDLSGIRAKLLVDGEPEVSIFWTEPGGFRCKIRVDYLRATDALDLKTYANTMHKDRETVIAHTIATHRYHVSAFWYQRGIEAMRKMVKAQGRRAVKSEGLADWHADLIDGIAANDAPGFPLWFVFLQTGGVPNVTVRRFIEHDASTGELNAYYRAAQNETNRATNLFARYMKSHGPDRMWIDEAPLKPFADEDFAAARWILDEQ